jgi:hypothetical protein
MTLGFVGNIDVVSKTFTCVVEVFFMFLKSLCQTDGKGFFCGLGENAAIRRGE